MFLYVVLFGYSTPAGRRYQQLQNQVEHLQDELYRTEAGKKGCLASVLNVKIYTQWSLASCINRATC